MTPHNYSAAASVSIDSFTIIARMVPAIRSRAEGAWTSAAR